MMYVIVTPMGDYKKYDRTILDNLQTQERKLLLLSLETDLTNRLKPFADWDKYWKEVDSILNELRHIGHDLWSHDYDGEGKHLWGWDYMRMETAGFLQMQFDFNGRVRIFWREDDPKLGTVDEDE